MSDVETIVIPYSERNSQQGLYAAGIVLGADENLYELAAEFDYELDDLLQLNSMPLNYRPGSVLFLESLG